MLLIHYDFLNTSVKKTYVVSISRYSHDQGLFSNNRYEVYVSYFVCLVGEMRGFQEAVSRELVWGGDPQIKLQVTMSRDSSCLLLATMTVWGRGAA